MVDIQTLSSADLEQTLENYPWFTAARAEYVLRQGGTTMDREPIMAYARRFAVFFLSRGEFRNILEKRIAGEPESPAVQVNEESPTKPKKNDSYYVVGGDYFTKEDFQELERNGLAVESPVLNTAALESDEPSPAPKVVPDQAVLDEILTETLAEVFADQMFYQRAIDIYKKLILLYPEKSVYFASLIEKLENLKQK